VLDRATGTPVWPIEERPVPSSTVPGEHASPTQPIPTKPPAFDRQGITEDDLIDFTPELRQRAKEILKDYVTGPMYTPPSLLGDKKGTYFLPGNWGAANWHTGAFDPETGIYYAVSHTLPGVYDLVTPTDAKATMRYVAKSSGRITPDIEGLPLVKPPYGRITALDLNKGEQVWMAANGDGPRDHPLLKHLNLPPLGIPSRPAPLLTKTLLFLGEGSNAITGALSAPWGWGKKFRAYDKATGRVIWEMELPSGTTGAPMTYMAGRKQIIIVPIGDRETRPEFVALGLP
jgi:quinoprotein glucose dehydrogenase